MKYWLLVLAIVLSFSFSVHASSTKISFTGVTPIYPEARGQVVENLQPTLRWKPSHDSNVTYDVIIYEAVVGEERNMAGPLIIQRNNIPATSYKVEKPLKQNTNYFWSVRSRQGDKVSRWSRYGYTSITSGGLVIRYHKKYSNQYFTFETPER